LRQSLELREGPRETAGTADVLPSREKVFQAPPVEWIKDRLRTRMRSCCPPHGATAQVLRDLLGPIRMELVTPGIGRPSTAPSRRSMPWP